MYLKQSVRSRYGEKFLVLEVPGEIVLIPVADDPVQDLARLGRPLKDKSLDELKAGIVERAVQEIRAR
jgi:hypothetical protein